MHSSAISPIRARVATSSIGAVCSTSRSSGSASALYGERTGAAAPSGTRITLTSGLVRVAIDTVIAVPDSSPFSSPNCHCLVRNQSGSKTSAFSALPKSCVRARTSRRFHTRNGSHA
jgi:hypothetical protein